MIQQLYHLRFEREAREKLIKELRKELKDCREKLDLVTETEQEIEKLIRSHFCC
jgi:hypothetical protein